MNNPNLFQLLFLIRNNKDQNLSNIINKEDFIFLFLNHLKEHFQGLNRDFRILEPLLDPELEKEQNTTLSIDGIEVGELYLLCNSFFEESSLVYYSSSGLIESILLEYDEYDDYRISDYILLINEFSNYILGEQLFYAKIKNHD